MQDEPCTAREMPVVKSCWIHMDNCNEDGKLRVELRINGEVYDTLFTSVFPYEKGNETVCQSHNLTWILFHRDKEKFQ